MHHPWNQSHDPYNVPLPIWALRNPKPFLYLNNRHLSDSRRHHKTCNYTSDGHAVHIMCNKIGKVWDMVPLRQSFYAWNFGDNTIQITTNTIHTSQPTKKKAEWLLQLCILRGLQTKKHDIRIGYLTPYLLGGPKEGGNAMSPVHSRGSPNKNTQSQSKP